MIENDILCGFKKELIHKRIHRFDITVKINSADHSFESITQAARRVHARLPGFHPGPGAWRLPAEFFGRRQLAVVSVCTKAERIRVRFAFRHFRELMVQPGAHHKIKDGIAQKLKSFIIFQCLRVFVEVRAMCQGATQKAAGLQNQV